MQRGVASKDHNGRETAGDNNPTSNEQAVNLNRSAVRSPAMSKSISVAQVKKEREQTSAGACSQFPSRLQRKHDGVAIAPPASAPIFFSQNLHVKGFPPRDVSNRLIERRVKALGHFGLYQ
jgi:hypothetical protein